MDKKKMGRPSKLTPLEKESAYQMYKDGISQTEIAYKFKVSVRTIGRLIESKK